jgi:hypothetical protein
MSGRASKLLSEPGDFGKDPANIGAYGFKVREFILRERKDSDFHRFVKPVSFQPNRLAHQPFDPVATDGGTVFFADEDTPAKPVAGLGHQGKRNPRKPLTVTHQIGDFDPVFKAEAPGKPISFGQR